LEARQVLVVGMRAASGLAHHFSPMLRQLLGPKAVLLSDVRMLPEVVSGLTGEDLLIAVSFPRHSAWTIEAARVASAKGTRVVATTNSVMSPLAEYAGDRNVVSVFQQGLRQLTDCCICSRQPACGGLSRLAGTSGEGASAAVPLTDRESTARVEVAQGHWRAWRSRDSPWQQLA
jgi:hypothetical protein